MIARAGLRGNLIYKKGGKTMPKGKTVFVAAVTPKLWARIRALKKKKGRMIYHIVETALTEYLDKEEKS